MNRYLIRTELFGNPTWQTYNRLHAAMERRGFSKTITVSSGETYDLPTASYYLESGFDLQQVYDEAKTAANAVWTSSGIVAAEAESILVGGLKQHGRRRLFG